ISWLPAGNLSSSGWASTPYRRLAIGSRATNTSSRPPTPRNRRDRSSTRWSTSRAAPPSDAAFGSVAVISPSVRGPGRLTQLGAGVAQVLAGLAQCIAALAQAALQLLAGQVAFEFRLHRMPLRTGPAHPQA